MVNHVPFHPLSAIRNAYNEEDQLNDQLVERIDRAMGFKLKVPFAKLRMARKQRF